MRISDWSSDVCSSDLETDVDPEMAHLFLWHAAEEVEHRHVAYDVYHHIGGGYLRLAAAMVPLAGLVLLGWPLLTSEVMRRDPSARGRWSWRAHLRSARRSEEHTSELQSLMRSS